MYSFYVYQSAAAFTCVQVTIPAASAAPTPAGSWGPAEAEFPVGPSAAMEPGTTFKPPGAEGTVSKPLWPHIAVLTDTFPYLLCSLTQVQ
jgi:hypothetical protein